MSMKIVVSTERCVGGGQCVMAAPEVFDQRPEDGIVVLLDSSPDETEADAVQDAIALCPAAAIALQES